MGKSIIYDDYAGTIQQQCYRNIARRIQMSMLRWQCIYMTRHSFKCVGVCEQCKARELSEMVYPYRRHPLKTLQCPAAGTRPPPPAEVPLEPPAPQPMLQMCCSSCTHSKHAPEDVTHRCIQQTHTHTHRHVHHLLAPLFNIMFSGEVFIFLPFAEVQWMNVIFYHSGKTTEAPRWAATLCQVSSLLSSHQIHYTQPPHLYVSLGLHYCCRHSLSTTFGLLGQLWEIVLRKRQFCALDCD